MNLTKDDLEWLDRIGVDSKRMKIIKDNYEKARKWDKHLEDLDEWSKFQPEPDANKEERHRICRKIDSNQHLTTNELISVGNWMNLRELTEKEIEKLKKDIPELDSLCEGTLSGELYLLQGLLEDSKK